jgi:hypothetical protein
MFQTIPLSIIRSFSLYTQQWYMSYRFVDICQAGSGWNILILLDICPSCQQTCMTYAVRSGQIRRSCRQLNIPIPFIFQKDLNFQVDYQCCSCFLLVHSLITLLAACAHIPSAGTHPISGCVEPCLANSSAMSFPSIPMCPGTHISWILLCSVSFTREWWLPDCRKEYRYYYLCSPFLYFPLYKPQWHTFQPGILWRAA